MRKLKSLIWIITILVANSSSAQLVLERSLLLTHYPSGSAIEFHKNNLYLVGDDATQLIILNANYVPIDSIRLYKGMERISKNKKSDLEASTIISTNESSKLLLLGSSSTKRRQQVTTIPLATKSIETVSIKRFNRRLLKLELRELNFEGLTAVNNQLMIANRGHLNNRTNQFIVTDNDFYKNQSKATIHIINITFDLPASSFQGISGLTYDATNDILFFSASTENTSTTYGDGDISDSYIGWIRNFSSKMKNKDIIASELINLSENNQSFTKQKIESLTIQEVQGNTYILHLVSDNDNGQSTLFNARLTIK